MAHRYAILDRIVSPRNVSTVSKGIEQRNDTTRSDRVSQPASSGISNATVLRWIDACHRRSLHRESESSLFGAQKALLARHGHRGNAIEGPQYTCAMYRRECTCMRIITQPAVIGLDRSGCALWGHKRYVLCARSAAVHYFYVRADRADLLAFHWCVVQRDLKSIV